MKEFETRMRSYEINTILPSNMPIIIRIDGRAFSRFTMGMDKPFDEKFIEMMNLVAQKVCEDIQGCKMAYIQSDEISFLVYQTNLDADNWFSNKIEKMCSIVSSKASSVATKWIIENIPDKNPIVCFDARANTYPMKEVANYFIWRQKDWERNSLFMVASSYFSAKALRNKNKSDQNDMIFSKGDNWNDYKTYLKRGRCCVKVKRNIFIENEKFTGEVERTYWEIDNEIPIFTQDRNYILTKLENNSNEQVGDENE